MRNRSFSRLGLFNQNITWWFIGLVLAIPTIYVLDSIAKEIYPSQIDDMGLAFVQRLHAKLTFLILLNIITPTILDVIKIFFTDSNQNNSMRGIDRSYFSLAVSSESIRQPILLILIRILIVTEISFIVSVTNYLIKSGFETLNASMDFLLGGPGIDLTIAYALFIVNYSLIFYLLLFSFLWAPAWTRWVSSKVFYGVVNNKYYPLLILLFSLVPRGLQALLLIIIVNFMVNFSGKLNMLIGIMLKTSLILCLWAGICILPFLYEKIMAKSKIRN